jgi:IS5 family transposase
MRKIIDFQIKLTGDPIADAAFDLQSRDEIPKLLMGLQYIYLTASLRKRVFEILKNIVPKKIDANNGRPGMDLWKILVLGTLRLNCNWDYDKVQEIANNHRTVRMMLGHEESDFSCRYSLQCIKDNVTLFTPDTLEQINAVVVTAGHDLLGHDSNQPLKGKCDSVVVETNVHYPTDINLLYDAIRKVIEILASMCLGLGISEWRQSRHNLKQIRKLFHRARNLKRSKAKGKEKKEKQEQAIIAAHVAYVDLVESFLTRAKTTIYIVEPMEIGMANMAKLLLAETYIDDAFCQIEQIRRRVLKGETIPHHEKIFSIFQRHTEWICKGKAGINQELGLRVAIIADQYGFILHHQVMEKQTDDKVAVSMVEQTQKLFPSFNGCSFDKGFYSPENRGQLETILENLVLPQKGRPSNKQAKLQDTEQWKADRRKHSAVEAAISALENHGLDRCPDNGITGFKRYVALAILGRNLQILGHVVQQRALEQEKRRKAA